MTEKEEKIFAVMMIIVYGVALWVLIDLLFGIIGAKCFWGKMPHRSTGTLIISKAALILRLHRSSQQTSGEDPQTVQRRRHRQCHCPKKRLHYTRYFFPETLSCGRY